MNVLLLSYFQLQHENRTAQRKGFVNVTAYSLNITMETRTTKMKY